MLKRLTVKILSFLRLTAKFLAVLRLTVNPIETLLNGVAAFMVMAFLRLTVNLFLLQLTEILEIR